MLDSDDICLPCIDLVFIPLIDDAERYFPAADRMTSTLMQLLIDPGQNDGATAEWRTL
jgi:hypothetical protein